MRPNTIRDAGADDAIRPVFARAPQRDRRPPNAVQLMARCSVAAELCLPDGDLNAASTPTAVERERFAVLLATNNGCGYRHTAHGPAARARHVGSPEIIVAATSAASTDPYTAAMLGSAAKAVAHAGRLAEEKITRTRAERPDDTTTVDIVSVIAENVHGNTVNNLAQTTVDSELPQAAHCYADVALEVR
jgi:AhpD family alkylhydroperoxidase